MGRNVARTARIAIVVPCSSDVIALLDKEKRVHPSFAQLDGHAKAGETAADDEYVDADFFSWAALIDIFRHQLSRYLAGCF